MTVLGQIVAIDIIKLDHRTNMNISKNFLMFNKIILYATKFESWILGYYLISKSNINFFFGALIFKLNFINKIINVL